MLWAYSPKYECDHFDKSFIDRSDLKLFDNYSTFSCQSFIFAVLILKQRLHTRI